MSKVVKATFGLMIVTVIAKISGFGRELVLASAYGANMYSDAYLVAMNIPLVIFSSIGTAIGTTFIPIYFDIKNEVGEKRALKFTNNFLNIVMILCIILVIISILFIDPIVKIFAFGFDKETFNIAVNFTRIFLIGIVFTGLSFVMTSYLQAKNNFAIPGFISVPKNIIIIISIILSTKYGPYFMVWGTLLGMITELLFQIPFAIKNGYKYKLYINIKDKYIKKSIYLILPVFIGVAVNQVNAMVDRSLASTLVEGSISALNYANKLNGFVMTLFITSISSVIYPMLSKLSSEGSKDKFNEYIVRSINTIIILVMPISIGAIVFARPIVEILFQRGKFDLTATDMTSIALVMYAIGMVPYGLRDVIGKIFYSLQDTKTPMVNGSIAMGMNILINMTLIRKFKHAGLALGTSITVIICTIMLFINLKKKIGYFGQDKILKSAIKSSIAAIIMGILTHLLYNSLTSIFSEGVIYKVISLLLVIIVGVVLYTSLIIILKIDEVNIIRNIIKGKMKVVKI